MGGEGAEDEGQALAVAAEAGQAQRQTGPYGVVQLVGGGVQFGSEQLDALLRLPDVAQRTGQLDLGAPALVAAGSLSPSARASRYSGTALSEWPVESQAQACSKGARGLSAGSSATRASITARKSAAALLLVVVEGGPGGGHTLFPVCVHLPTLAQRVHLD